MDQATIETVRRFNRTVTERIGALDATYLGRGRPLGETRLLWEVGEDGADVRDLRRRLGLDAGYASRLLRALESRDLVVVEPNPCDRRVRRARLTPAGATERGELDRLSDRLVRDILESLDGSRRARLVAAMEVVERLLQASAVTVEPADPEGADGSWCLAHYFAELAQRFESGFDPGRSIPATAAELRPPAGVLLVARLHGEPVACGALKFTTRSSAELKRMWVSPRARGLGLGRRMLVELEQRATEAGMVTVRLETNGALVEAIALYRSSGYVEVEPFNDEPYAHHWFEKRLGPASPSAPSSDA